MWRRLLSSQLKTLSMSTTIGRSHRSVISAPSYSSTVIPHFSSVLARFLSADAASGGTTKTTVEDIMPIATGHEREELEAELEGRKVIDIDHPEGPFGTKESPAVIKSYYDKRIVGCPGVEGEDEHDVVWFWLSKDQPHECPVCSQWFALEVVGPGGDPEEGGHGAHH